MPPVIHPIGQDPAHPGNAGSSPVYSATTTACGPWVGAGRDQWRYDPEYLARMRYSDIQDPLMHEIVVNAYLDGLSEGA